ncbi:MAG: DUF2207 domain-containing protein [Rhizobiales bacterium]|nr:DUF2207 domain-containing protein [Hyphomicrobiales bacterium]
MGRLAATLAFLLLLAAPSAVLAREEIIHFKSLVEVQTNGDVLVTETITVRAEGRNIKRGIYRDLPYRYVDRKGEHHKSGVKVLGVDSNVTGDAHFTKREGEHLRIYAGETSRYLSPGTYTYTFRYSMVGHVGFFDDFDEIYWNVTGNRWSFPIVQVTARIVLPEGAKVLQTAGYTGRRGQTGTDYDARTIGDNIVEFKSTRPLARGEGMTVAVGWPKGFVVEPTASEKTFSWLFGNIGLLALLASAAAVPWYLFKSWLRVGRDPEKGVIIPLFTPPEGLSPAAISYIHYMKLKSAGRGASRALIAALISLAVKKRVSLEEDGDEVTVYLKDRNINDLPSGEYALHRALFATGDSFTFNKSNASRFSTIRKNFQKAIKGEHRGIYFNDNYGHFWIAAVLGVVGVAAYFLIQQPSGTQAGVFIVMAVLAAFGSVVVIAGIHGLKQSGITGYIGPAIALIFFGNFGKAFVGTGDFEFSPETILSIVAVAVMLLSIAVFAYLLRAPTPLGRRTMDMIEGLKLYMSVAESERMNMNDAPDMTEQLFEKLLPFAIALDVERPWSNAFADHMARMVPAERDDGYQPSWYRGRRWGNRGLGRATEGMISAMSSSMASAVPVSSGSGSSGGGFSGGGGGGGGGGGW